jgi:hypothetical protein
MFAILTYAITIGGVLTTNTVELSTMAECLKEKDRIELYYLETYKSENYSITTTCDQHTHYDK